MADLTKTLDNTLNQRLPPLQKMEFYSLGKETKNPSLQFAHNNIGFADTAANIYDRNYMKNNIFQKENHFTTSNNIFFSKKSNLNDTNNYLNPISSINKAEKPINSNNLLNQRLYNTYRSKNYTMSIDNSQEGNRHLSNKDYLLKRDSSLQLENTRPVTDTKLNLEDNNLKFDKNNKIVFRYPPGYFVDNKEKQTRTKISSGSPEWFNVVNEKKMREYNDKLNKEDTLFIISRYQSWITVTPKSKNRKKPLEKSKAANMEQTSKVVPNWMQIKHPPIPDDFMMSNKYNSQRPGEKEKKYVMLVDKNQYNKSVFNIGDFRHNVATKENADLHMNKVSKSPKEFFSWSGKERVYNPHFKKDVVPEKVEEYMKNKEEFNKKIDQKYIKKKDF